MTMREMWQWAVNNCAEDVEVGVLYQDAGGYYFGNTFEDGREITIEFGNDYNEEAFILIG